MKYTRRDFIKTSAAAGAAAGISEFAALPSSRVSAAGFAPPGNVHRLAASGSERAEARTGTVPAAHPGTRSVHSRLGSSAARESRRGTGRSPKFRLARKTSSKRREWRPNTVRRSTKAASARRTRQSFAMMRSRGAVLLGKTVTTAFAYRTPGPTRNPRNLEHTPGGSSSGSAAAVAAGMVPFTIGEQTRGSMIRPASFCGITGFKPTTICCRWKACCHLAKSQDTLGLYTHTPTDMLALWKALGYPDRPRRAICVWRSRTDPRLRAGNGERFRQSVALLRRAGVEHPDD